jgi:hypothetical protein
VHNLAALYLASGTDPINTGNISTILGSIFGILVLVVAIRAVMHAFRGGFAAVLTVVVIVAVGAMVFGLATSNLLGALGGDMVRAFLNL